MTAPIRTVAGADISYNLGSDTLYAAVVVLNAQTMKVVEIGRSIVQATMPYIPGLLSFREAPGIIAAYRALEEQPDLLIVDGHGRAHRRRLGIASHIGVLLDQATIGCGKSRLTGRYEEPALERGSFSALYVGGELIGEVVRTRTGVKPVFVSVGHRIALDQARELVLQFSPRLRLPAPTRHAHNEANRMRTSAL